MKTGPKYSLEYYGERHLQLRNEILQAKFLIIRQEAKTFNIMIRGLAEGLSLVPHIPTMLLQQYVTVRVARVAMEALASTVSAQRTQPRQIGGSS